eukprot:TRINITY_DN63384_c0_g1_i1.p1 TRINITY_DN63384_c0_g1~~TRINITY_DN63384_c0_g1_i1.p1  ORF type:complete len:264 (-),score=36.77 TRINITY_DN63384_c0_g1_i1:91-882(-)
MPSALLLLLALSIENAGAETSDSQSAVDLTLKAKVNVNAGEGSAGSALRRLVSTPKDSDTCSTSDASIYLGDAVALILILFIVTPLGVALRARMNFITDYLTCLKVYHQMYRASLKGWRNLLSLLTRYEWLTGIVLTMCLQGVPMEKFCVSPVTSVGVGTLLGIGLQLMNLALPKHVVAPGKHKHGQDFAIGDAVMFMGGGYNTLGLNGSSKGHIIGPVPECTFGEHRTPLRCNVEVLWSHLDKIVMMGVDDIGLDKDKEVTP